jgi:hypothetical protein
MKSPCIAFLAVEGRVIEILHPQTERLAAGGS